MKYTMNLSEVKLQNLFNFEDACECLRRLLTYNEILYDENHNSYKYANLYELVLLLK